MNNIFQVNMFKMAFLCFSYVGIPFFFSSSLRKVTHLLCLNCLCCFVTMIAFELLKSCSHLEIIRHNIHDIAAHKHSPCISKWTSMVNSASFSKYRSWNMITRWRCIHFDTLWLFGGRWSVDRLMEIQQQTLGIWSI